MRIRYSVAALLLGLVFNVQTSAADEDLLAQVEPPTVSGLINEQDITLLFDYVRMAMFAASQGFPVPPPPEELRQRVESLGNQLKSRSALSALALLNALEAHAKRALRDSAPPRPALPPPVPQSQPARD